MAERVVTLRLEDDAKSFFTAPGGTAEDYDKEVRVEFRLPDATRAHLSFQLLRPDAAPEAQPVVVPARFVWAPTTSHTEFKLVVTPVVSVGAARAADIAPEAFRKGHVAVNKKEHTVSKAGQNTDKQLLPSLHKAVHDAVRPVLARCKTLRTQRHGLALKPWSHQSTAAQNAAVAAARAAILAKSGVDEDEAKVRLFVATFVKNNYCGAKRRAKKAAAMQAAARPNGDSGGDEAEEEDEDDEEGEEDDDEEEDDDDLSDGAAPRAAPRGARAQSLFGDDDSEDLLGDLDGARKALAAGDKEDVSPEAAAAPSAALTPAVLDAGAAFRASGAHPRAAVNKPYKPPGRTGDLKSGTLAPVDDNARSASKAPAPKPRTKASAPPKPRAPPPPEELCDYEKERNARVERNASEFAELGIQVAVQGVKDACRKRRRPAAKPRGGGKKKAAEAAAAAEGSQEF